MIALLAIVAAAVLAALLLLGGGGGYTAKARFQNASQLVKGNLVQVSGQAVGKVEKIDLTMPAQSAPKIPDGGVIGQDATTSAVDLDQLFNTLDADTRKDLQAVFKGSRKQYAGQGQAMNEGLMYLNPSLSASSKLFNELNRDTPLLERFVVASSKLVTDVADRQTDLAGVVDNLATTTTAIGSEQAALADAIGQLPPFMRRANTTFLNLRAALDDLDPLVEESKPVAKKLRPFMAELRPLARDARPTFADLAEILRRPGADNDALELTRLQPSLRDATVREVEANGKERQAAFPAITRALKESAPIIASVRPYAPDALGWFDDFSHSGIYDALGAASRVGVHASAFVAAGGLLSPVPPELRGAAFEQAAALDQRNRCPGSADHVNPDGSNPWKPAEVDCDPSQVLPGK